MTITIGTTPVNLLLLLRGEVYAGASLPASYPANPNQRPTCDILAIKNDDASPGKLAWGDTSNISITDANDVIAPGEQFNFGSGHYPNQISVAKWLVAEAADTDVHISINYS